MPLLGSLGHLARSISASYAIAYLLTLFALLAASCLGLSARVVGPLRWALFTLRSIIGLATMAFSAFVALRRPALLRHEKVALIHRTLDIIGDDELDSETRHAVQETMIRLLPGERETHKPKSMREDGFDE